jgi:hypothetical protein
MTSCSADRGGRGVRCCGGWCSSCPGLPWWRGGGGAPHVLLLPRLGAGAGTSGVVLLCFFVLAPWWRQVLERRWHALRLLRESCVLRQALAGVSVTPGAFQEGASLRRLSAAHPTSHRTHRLVVSRSRLLPPSGAELLLLLWPKWLRPRRWGGGRHRNRSSVSWRREDWT